MDQLYNTNNKMLLLKLLWWHTIDLFFLHCGTNQSPQNQTICIRFDGTHGVGWGGGGIRVGGI